MILPEEKEAIELEQIELFQGIIPKLSQKISAFERGHAALGVDYYINIRDIIISLFYWSPEQYLSLERCIYFIKVSIIHFSFFFYY